jgi:hypothetical protein
MTTPAVNPEDPLQERSQEDADDLDPQADPDTELDPPPPSDPDLPDDTDSSTDRV